jgi:perosamine synthetase
MDNIMRLFNTTVTKRAIDLVNDSLESTFISAGNKADEFEAKLSEKLFMKRPVTVNSGTSALHLALASTGVTYGDEVILPAQTFIASGLAILHQGAKPVFADINYMTGNIDPESIKSKITNKTKAIMVVHWGGYPCDMDEINKIATENNLVVIEDAAHALGSYYKGNTIGTISDYTCFSFQAIKHLTCGDGGAICSLTDENEKRLKKLRWFNIDREDDNPDILGERVYNSNEIGYKYHMNDISAAVGLGNLESIDIKLKRYLEISNRYNIELNGVSGVNMFDYKNDRSSSYWLYGFHVERREDFINKLKSFDIPSSVIHLGIDRNDLFGGKDMSLINQRNFDDTQINIPIHDGLSDEEVDKIITTIKSGW